MRTYHNGIDQIFHETPFSCHGQGKGYPDIATRQFVKTLGDVLHPRIPILAIVDGDPYGIDILSVYKFGSRSLQHENAKLAAERIIWLGLKPSELTSVGIDRDKLLQITKHDEAKVSTHLTYPTSAQLTLMNQAFSLLRRSADVMPADWRLVSNFYTSSLSLTLKIAPPRLEKS
ncbi:hypothetical protein H0H92_006687 [Tricholoma furcatifolium]|nr:hypothetical protein H0H92_006687 [Tricholoma furcatifolium]